MTKQLWADTLIGDEHYALMNLNHAQIEERIIADMDAGVDVYYDNRWAATGILSEWLAQNLELIQEKNVLILGAGVGSETLVLGRHCKHVWINDLSAVALELCAEQMDQNSFKNYTTLCGRYEELDLPEVDLVVASFLIYNKDTYTAMRSFIANHKGEVILMNERLGPFPKFLEQEAHTIIFEIDDAVGVLLKRG
ncbi:methyltransferase domain-containing protein [Rubellicoccus peritrichatus]|uniref:Methyltransferase domain-containing protein n=1 Tax=Rubellicoccus peritrichatus TaxID=3080537 RepID=A0AAQ3L5J7_9BACT|nr:methyltransferase domain-containing protein [Puniceicoccus sp. CR14]WOO39416.1 methyltransferase domain-containing protein [Puniceicoccus sp. CR14]